MRIAIALGGNALLRKGEPLTAENQLKNIQNAAAQIAKLVPHHEIIVTHGNGPQVGLLALQAHAYQSVKPYPLDILDAQTEGMIGYLLEQEIANFMDSSQQVVTLLTRVEVDPADLAFKHPTKPIGPLYSKEEAASLIKEKGWQMVWEEKGYRRVVASPFPQRIVTLAPILCLLKQQMVVIAAGGGGIPVIKQDTKYKGVEAVIDKDLCSALLAKEIKADCLLIATDVEGVYLDWGKPTQYPIREISLDELKKLHFAAGSMAPKVQAACQFVETTRKMAVIGSLEHIEELLKGSVGTYIKL